MNDEIRCITKKGKTTKNEWKSDGSDFRQASYSIYIKNRTILFPQLLIDLFKQRNINSVKL